FFFSSRRRHTRFSRDWSSDVCSRSHDRRDDVGQERQEDVLPRSGRNRHVDRVALALALALEAGGAGARIERPLVDARVEDVGAVDRKSVRVGKEGGSGGGAWV